MIKNTRTLVKEFIHPFFVRGLRFVLRKQCRNSEQERLRNREQERLRDSDKKQWGLRGVDWYNYIYEQPSDYNNHYSESRYYFIWSVVVDRIIRSGVRKVLDMGCGPGQLASLLYDHGLKNYCGIDFSPKCIEMAKQRCPSFKFIVTDIGQSDILETSDYDCIVALEFLEHVEKDTELINRIPSGIKFYGSVPNFSYISHVRHFSDKKQVISRYQRYFSHFQVDAFLEDPKGKTYYLIEATK